jgi:acetyl-CoA carboxylase carboxyl transferase subunit alpha
LEGLENISSMAIDKELDSPYQRLMQYGQFAGD